MSLSDIYVEPEYLVYKRSLLNNKERIKIDKDFVSSMQSIHKYIKSLILRDGEVHPVAKNKEYVLKNDPPSFLFILGYPGQGKSSFCKRLVYDLTNKVIPTDRSVFFISLRHIKLTRDLLSSPLHTIKKTLEDRENIEINNNEFSTAIIILDGLDELYIRDHLSNAAIESFCNELINSTEKQLVFITSRYGFINFYKIQNWKTVILQLREFRPSQQASWIEKYKRFHPTIKFNRERILELNDSFPHIRELLGQPILLHMVATTDFNVTRKTNRSKIYERLFDLLIDRRWVEKNEFHKNIFEVNKHDIRAAVQDIALLSFKKNSNFLYEKDILKLTSIAKFNKKLFDRSFFHDTLKAVMISFYFSERRYNCNLKAESDYQKYAIEFLHKSLQEYLTAERIWEYFIENYLEKYKDLGGEAELMNIAEIFGYNFLPLEICSYLVEVINNDTNTDKISLSNNLSKHIHIFVEKDFFSPIGHNADISIVEQCTNTFYGYWTVLSNLVRNVNYLNEIDEKNIERFFENIRRIPANKNFVINLRYQKAKNINLSGINLTNCDFSYSELENANFSRSVLQYCNFQKCKINSANFESSNLRNCIFINADISKSDLTNADLTNSKLDKANLYDSTLVNTTLVRSNLFYANISFSNISGATVAYANFENCNAKKTNGFESVNGLKKAKNINSIEPLAETKFFNYFVQ